MNIPDKAVEAATKALHRYDLQEGLSGYLKPSEHHIAEARAAVEAAAPYLYAQALRDAADQADRTRPPVWDLARDASGVVIATTVTVDALRARADELDPHE